MDAKYTEKQRALQALDRTYEEKTVELREVESVLGEKNREKGELTVCLQSLQETMQKTASQANLHASASAAKLPGFASSSSSSSSSA